MYYNKTSILALSMRIGHAMEMGARIPAMAVRAAGVGRSFRKRETGAERAVELVPQCRYRWWRCQTGRGRTGRDDQMSMTREAFEAVR